MSYVLDEVPNCCAVGVIQQVGEKSLAEIKQAIEDVKKLNKRRDDAGGPIHNSEYARGAIVATTNHTQTAAIQNLRKLRFTKAFEVRNPKTSNMVTLWYKLLTRPKRNK